jgi:hypothetical protein
MVKLNQNTLISSYCKFLKYSAKKIPEVSLNCSGWKKVLEKMCIFSFTWSLGAVVSSDGRARIDKGISDTFSPDCLKSPLNNFVVDYSEK